MAQTRVETMADEECCSCGVRFAMPQHLQDLRREDGRWFYCPNGHQMHYTKSRQEKLDTISSERDHWKAEAERLLAETDKLREKLGKKSKRSVVDIFHRRVE